MNPLFSHTKDILRNAKNGGFVSAWECLLSGRIRGYLERLPHSPHSPEAVEVHVLSGHTRLPMALWMAASLQAASGRDWTFVIHDDGTLQAKDACLIERLFPGSRTILSAESTPKVRQQLASYPLCMECRDLHPFGRRLFDFPLFAKGDRYFSFDTDILFFREPRRLVQWMTEAHPSSLFMRDIEDTSLLSDAEIMSLCGKAPVKNVNAGMMAIPKEILSLDLFESCLRETRLLQRDSWFIEQTLFALTGAASGRVELLDSEYVMTLDAVCPSGAAARHYPGVIRHLFYSEGIPRVKKLLRAGNGLVG